MSKRVLTNPERLLMTTQDPETGKQREWQFRTSTTEDRDKWVAVLQMAQDKFVGKNDGLTARRLETKRNARR